MAQRHVGRGDRRDEGLGSIAGRPTAGRLSKSIMMKRDTIFALSSGRPPAGVALIRISGDKALETLKEMANRAVVPRAATLVPLRSSSGELLDRALVLAFPAPHSFTGEDVAELHVHGGAAVISAVLDDLSTRAGLRLAEAGEFSRRAFDNGKLDLTEAEGLADLIAAETEAQRRQAMAQGGGRLRERAENWRTRILTLQAAAEAGLDFSDEEDVGDGRRSDDLAALIAELDSVLADNGLGERLREGFTIAVVGKPNVGKSSLINALVGRDAAIVTDIAGTTRDVIEVPVSLGGVPVTLLDTAGLRESNDPIEAEGIRRARLRAEAADLVIHVCEAGHEGIWSPGAINVVSKIDLAPWEQTASTTGVSARTGVGLVSLTQRLTDWATVQSSRAESAVITRRRHRLAIEDVAKALKAAASELDSVIYAEWLRSAAFSLGQLTGRVGSEDMLDTLFGGFCIGK